MLGRRARGLLLLLVGVTTALKLQPVQQSTLKVDLITEAKNSAVILSSAVALIQDDAKTVDKDAVRELLSTAEFHKLKAFVYRWYSMENKLKGLLEGASMRQIRSFEDIAHNVAGSSVVLGVLQLFVGNSELALAELEPSCPVLWDLKASWRSLTRYGWLDCYKYLGDIYSAKASNVEQQALRETFLSNMGWLKGSLLNANNEADVFQCFLKLSDSDRRGIAKEVKNAWALSEGIRDSFQILVTDFLTADAARLKKGIYARAQTVTEDILQQYLISVNDDLVLSSTAESKDPAVKVNFGALRMTLHSEIKREAQSFLYLMRNVLEKGVEFLTELHSGKHGLRNEDGKEDMASVLGFLSEEDILLLFEESFHNSLASFSVASAADETSSYAVVEEDIIATEASEIKQDISNAYVNDQKFDNAKKSTKRSTRKSSKKRRETAANGKKQAKNLSNNWDILWSALYFCGTTICAVAGAAWVGHTFKKARQQTVKSTNKVLLKPSTLLRRRYSSGNGSKTVETDTTKKLSYLQVLKENLLVFCEEVFNILALTFLSAKTFLLLIAGNVLLTVQHLIDTSSFSKNELNVSVEDTDNKLKLSKSAKLKQKASRSTSESYPVDRVVSPELNKSPKKTSKKRRFSHKNSEDLTEEKLEQAFISPDTDQKLGQPDSPSSVTYAENIFDDGQGWELVEKGGKVKSHSTSHKGFSEEKKDHSNFEGTRNGRALSHDSVGSIPTCESPELHSFPAVYVKNSKLSASAVLVSNSDNTLESSYDDDLPQELVEQLKEMDRVEFNCLSNENEDEGWICAGSKQKKHSKSVHQYSSQKVSGAVCVSTKKESVSAPTNNSKEFFNKKELGRKLLQSISQKKLPVAQEAENGYVRPGVAVSDGKAKGVPEATNSHQRISVGTPALHSGSITTNEDHEQSSISDMSINSGGEVVGDHIQMPMMQPVPMPMHIPMAMPLVPAQYLMMQQHYLMQQAHAMSAVSPMPLMHGYPIPMSPSPGFSYNGVAMPNDMNPFDGAAHFYGSQDEYHQGPQTSADGASPTLDSVDPYRSFSCTSGTGDIIDATRRQMEYYFSSNNLEKDAFLREKMDSNGFVLIDVISKFRRILSLAATPQMILTAVQSSAALELELALSHSDNINDEQILKSKVRTATNPLRWTAGK